MRRMPVIRPLFASLIILHSLSISPEAWGLVDPECNAAYEAVLQRLNSNDFETTRNLASYDLMFSDMSKRLFTLRLAALGKDGHWVDAGAGTGQALREYCDVDELHTSFPPLDGPQESIDTPLKFSPQDQRAKVTALGVVEPENAKTKGLDPRRFEYEEGLVEKKNSLKLGKADILTDLYGPFFYSKTPEKVLEKYLEFLKDDGAIYMGQFLGKGKTTIEGPNGEMTVVEWLQTIPGLNVKSLSYGGAVEITIKDRSAIKIPSLGIKSIVDGTPPERKYEVLPSPQKVN